jgi:aspartate racemase
MKTLGLLGGMSPESTVPYYREINARVAVRLGGLHSAKLVLWSVDFQEIEELQRAGEWGKAGKLLAHAAGALERAGAEILVMCTNTMHIVAPAIEAAVGIPLLHIADPTGEAIRRRGLSTVGLLGTRFTMEQTFYRDRLRDRHGLEVLTPAADEREIVHRAIYDELCLGRIVPESREAFRRIMARLVSSGAQAIVLGCTEIALLVDATDAAVPLFDTTRLHARAAADLALDALEARAEAPARNGASAVASLPTVVVDTDPERLDLALIHGFLAASYWARGIPFEVVRRSLRGSLCFGLYEGERQVGFARVVSDRATFAYLADVFVLDSHRGRGLSRLLMDAVVAHPELQGLRRWMLATRDAHGLYERYGFAPLAKPETFMQLHDPEVYARREA